MAEKIGVLVVDDSAFMRKVIGEIIQGSAEFFVVDTAKDGNYALAKLKEHGPKIQLVTLDIQMPNMNGLTCLKHIMEESPRRVVMVSALTTEGAKETLEALELGAVDFLAKPGGTISLDFKAVGPQLIAVLQAASKSRLVTQSKPVVRPSRSAITAKRSEKSATKLIAIASSTGGPSALANFIPHLPKNIGAALVLVQHMPATFTRLLAERLDRKSEITVREAEQGDKLVTGCCLIAPGGMHLEVTLKETIHLTKDPAVGGLRPCADITFHTIATVFRKRAMAVVLTGMGKDGTAGVKAMRKHGCQVIAESKETALIYGMPKSIVDNGLCDANVPIHKMAEAVTRRVANI